MITTPMLKRTTIIIFTMIALCQLALAGGVQLTSTCSNKACGYTTQYKTGNGKVSRVVSGYCIHCQRWSLPILKEVNRQWLQRYGMQKQVTYLNSILVHTAKSLLQRLRR